MPFVGDAVRMLGGTDVDVRVLARETPGVIDYVTGWWDDGLGAVRLTRDPAGALGELRVVVRLANSWFIEGGESARVFDDAERDEDRGPVDVPKLLGELRAIGPLEVQPAIVFEEVVAWLVRAHDDGAQVLFVRSA